ncbi:unnamed protein product [Lactuca virosa]|uniref:Uncharacterized protein n=1 Tax=Lactuca virosa TaxID=75947 RepID=A0AAU9NWT2_9ASTR|nr:unnamed protein product [Lactuca virosa]
MMNDQPQQEVEPQPQPQQEPKPQPQPQPQPRKKRTTTKLIDHKEPQEVDFNNIGQHVGKKQSKFANECGVITSILILKKQKRWNIPNDNRKKMCLEYATASGEPLRKGLKRNVEISKKARASSMHNKNPARVGPLGYRGKKAEWEQEMTSGQLTPQLYQIKSER